MAIVPKFFACSVGEPGKDYDKENLERIIQENAFVLHEDTIQKGEYENIREGDVLILKYQNRFIAYGEAKTIQKSSEVEWNLLAPVRQWYFKDSNNSEAGVGTYGIGYSTEAGGQYGTVKELNQSFGIKKIGEIDSSAPLYNLIINRIAKIKTEKEMKSVIELLKYKKQIILQGPPGTGKTKLAKLIADEMIKAEVSLTPLQYLDWYIKVFKSNKDSNEKNAQMHSLLNQFVTAFPIAEISNLTLDTYCQGKGSQDSFCYWIEKKLGSLGRFSPGLAGTTVYGVYYSQEQNRYVSTDKTPDQKLDDIKNALKTLLTTKNYTSAVAIFWKSFVLKILNTYFPNEYFPIFSRDHLKLVAKIFEIDNNGLDDIQLNQQINQKFLEIKMKYSSSISSTDFMQHLYAKFNLKKNDVTLEYVQVLDTLGEKRLIQFHPAYTYEDFVRGITADTNIKGHLEYKVENKTLAEFAQKALDNQAINYVLIIDEINRANLPSVLGELIYALEYRYNPDKPNENVVESMYSLKQDEVSGGGDRTLKLPNNLFIIGTMNTADRSVGHIDYAIRRRFAFVDILPKDLSGEMGTDFKSDIFKKVYDLFYDTEKKYLSSEFEPGQVCLGHSYFIQQYEKDGNGNPIKEKPIDFNFRLKYEIVPILKEYIKDGVLKDSEELRGIIKSLVNNLT